MTVGGRAATRERLLRRARLTAAVLVLLAVLFLISGHWILAVIVGAVAAVAIWVFLQGRAVR
jgi:uncharacterized membrane protein YccC